MHVLALDRDRQPVHHLIGHPDRRPGHDRQLQAVPGAHHHMPGSGGRSKPHPRHGRVRAQLRHILAGRLDVHGGHRHPGRVQQPGRRLLQDTGHHCVSDRPIQQQPQQLEIQTLQPQRHRPVTGVIGEHDEEPTVHGTAARRSSGPGISKHDADNRHGAPPRDSKTAIRATLISVRWPARGYPVGGRTADQGAPERRSVR